MGYDGIVIGGGAAGMFAAITAAKRGQKVLLLEKNDRLGRKLLITGKGRCNVTNNCTGQEVLQNVPRNGRFLYSAMTAFPPEKTMAFFEERGCRLKTERGNRVFPVTDKSQSVLDCLQSELHRQKITVKTARVRDILTQDGHVTGVRTQNEEIAANHGPQLESAFLSLGLVFAVKAVLRFGLTADCSKTVLLAVLTHDENYYTDGAD